MAASTLNEDIKIQLDVIRESLLWAEKYSKDTFPVAEFAKMRRSLRKIGGALEHKCAVAAYGESQVGKSYLMGSLLSSKSKSFKISVGDKLYDFVDDLNPSGGKTTSSESTGVITRFTSDKSAECPNGYVELELLSVSDLVMLLVDSFYNDLNCEYKLNAAAIDERLKGIRISATGGVAAGCVDADDIYNITDYIREAIGSKANYVNDSQFASVASKMVETLDLGALVRLFALLWDENEAFTSLFSSLLGWYSKINFRTEVFVPISALENKYGSLLDVAWLNGLADESELKNVFPKDENYNYEVEVYGFGVSFPKRILEALIREVVLCVDSEIVAERKFLRNIDLLDLPGARARLSKDLDDLSDGVIVSEIFRRGKVAYLFKKYSRELRISSLLFCHHNSQRGVPVVAKDMEEWIFNNIGATQEERRASLMHTQQISPFFFIATKFNSDLQKTTDKEENRDTLGQRHWDRFNKIYPELFAESWFNEWDNNGGFQDIYLLRDYFWSSTQRLFDGYNKKLGTEESSRCSYPDYPRYWEDLEETFVSNDFVKRHFRNPKETWNSVCCVGRDGSMEIVNNLSTISDTLENARLLKMKGELVKLKEKMIAFLSRFFESSVDAERNEKLKKEVGLLRLSLHALVGEDSYKFSHILDSMMIPADVVRRIAYDIVISKLELPKNNSSAEAIRAFCEIKIGESRDTVVAKLCGTYNMTEGELQESLVVRGTSIDEILGIENADCPSTEGGLVARNAISRWVEIVNKAAETLSEKGSYAMAIGQVLLKVFAYLDIRKSIQKQVDEYITKYGAHRKEKALGAISDYVALTINSFVSSAGRDFVSGELWASAREKGKNCGVVLNDAVSSSLLAPTGNLESDISEALSIMKESEDNLNGSVAVEQKIKLPMWNNFKRWENNLIASILICSNISDVDPVANGIVGELIERCKSLYNN